MLSFARRNAAKVAGPAKAALTACVFALAACGGEQPAGDSATTPTAGQTPVGDAAGSAQASTTSSGGTQSLQVAGTPAPLDTSTWVLQPPFSAAGQEPFWRLEIVDGWFAFRRSGLRAIEEPLAQPTREGEADVFRTGALQVSIKREACETEQGGSGEFTAKVTFDGFDFDGCAFGGALSNASSQEAAQVLDALGPIDACLAKLGQPALVTAVYPRQDGEQIALGLRAKNGQVYECATDAAGATVAYLDPIEQGSQPAWMSRMRFLRDGTATTTPCPDAEEVRSGEKVIGRLLTKACKF